MPFARPTLSELVTRIRADIRGRLNIAGSLLRRAMADVLAAVMAGTAHEQHGHIEWLSRQLFAFSAVREFLTGIASMYGITPIPATFATGTSTATGVNGTPIPATTVLVRDDGVTYTVDSLVVIAGGVAVLAVTAEEAGAAGDLVAGEEISFESPISGADSVTTVDAPGITGGFDEEDTEAFRTRFLNHLREPPTGGDDQDYIAWALEVAGTTRVWVYRHESGLGTLTVRFVQDDDPVSIFPSAGEVTTMQEALDAERPVTAEVTAAAPVDLPVAFTIEITPDTAALRTAIEAELDDLFFRDAEPGDGAGRGTVLLSRIQTAVGIGAGESDYTITVPAADVVPILGELATTGVITWV